MKLTPTGHPRLLKAEWKKETMHINLLVHGGSNGYTGAQLDNDVSPRIVECVNAMEGIEDPAAFMESVRWRATKAYRALISVDGDDADDARDFLSALIGSLPPRP